ncbi:Laminin subunit alpha-1 (Laminin A chain) (Laminin-1 subunit alpha) (Laminin-3 subunit alpha) (S-laminin subunit alpha) (S-LAM alpha) [Durusdinium trenchii]|uniref:Laminin subunit alpha-1 (Laminin A chain) (Laminin-1 subunit alpha) (Laminin-3 subunit alpha) (S-laminin subunit alpha) (S-LAM alpha) n=1 Tax=Durusdinium trenchii TaxID=1381693 RepID=A0ABP0QLV7_9DINO
MTRNPRAMLALVVLIIANVAEALATATPAGELRALESELQAEKRILSMVEKQHAQTTEKLQEKIAKKEKLHMQVQRMNRLNENLIHAEKDKEEVIREAKKFNLRINQSTVLLMDLSLDEEMKKAAMIKAQEQSAEMSRLTAQARHFRSDISHVQQEVKFTRQQLAKSEEEEVPLKKAEEKEAHETALLQERLKSRTAQTQSSRTKKAQDLAMTEQNKMLTKQNELAQVNFAIGNRSIFLEKEQGALEAERLHAEDLTKKATEMTDHLASEEEELKSDHRKITSLSTELSRNLQSTESMHQEVETLVDFIHKDATVGRQKVATLVQQLATKDAKMDALQKEVSTREAEVQDVMSQIKAHVNHSKEMLHKTKAQVLLQEAERKANASAISEEIEAARKESQEALNALKQKLAKEQSAEAAKKARMLKEFRAKHMATTFSAHAKETMARARLQAQRRQTQERSQAHAAAESRLTTEIQTVKTGASEAIRQSSSELNVLQKAITRVQAGEAVKVAKVNQQMQALMKSAKQLKKKFLETDSKVDRTIGAEAATARRLQDMKLEVAEKATAYDAAKRRVEKIYEELRAASGSHPAVRRLSKQLQEAKVHQERAVSLLSAKLQELQNEPHRVVEYGIEK